MCVGMWKGAYRPCLRLMFSKSHIVLFVHSISFLPEGVREIANNSLRFCKQVSNFLYMFTVTGVYIDF